VGLALFENFSEVDVLDDAIARMRVAAEFILDPHFLNGIDATGARAYTYIWTGAYRTDGD
jgi:hypothetical protein